MAHLTTKQVQARILELLESAPAGLQWAAMLNVVQAEHPETPSGTIRGSARLLYQKDDRVVKVARGTYQLAQFLHAESEAAMIQDEAVASKPVVVDTPSQQRVTLLESDFYAGFAEWLTEGDEVTRAEPLGGSILKGKWGTPDVLGVLRPRPGDVIQFEPQIVSAEMKIDTGQPVVAFGQAIAYRLFSHKSYIVVPKGTSGDDLGRLNRYAACTAWGWSPSRWIPPLPTTPS